LYLIWGCCCHDCMVCGFTTTYVIGAYHHWSCECLAACWWFSSGTQVSSTNKTVCNDITEILLKVALNTINQTKPTNLSDMSYWVHTFPSRIEVEIAVDAEERCTFCTIIYKQNYWMHRKNVTIIIEIFPLFITSSFYRSWDIYILRDNFPPLVATSADSVPSSNLVRITIAPIGTTFGNLQWRRY